MDWEKTLSLKWDNWAKDEHKMELIDRVENLMRKEEREWIDHDEELNFFLDLNIYFVAEIKILQLYYKFTTFINGKTTLFIFYINDSYDRHRLDFECQCNISQLTPSSSIAEKQQNFL